MNSALREDLCVAEYQFRRACEQVLVLNEEVEQLTNKYKEADAAANKTLRYRLRLRISVMEGVRNMFYEFAAMKASVITQLQQCVLASEVQDDSTGGDEFSEIVYSSGSDNVESDVNFDFC